MRHPGCRPADVNQISIAARSELFLIPKASTGRSPTIPTIIPTSVFPRTAKPSPPCNRNTWGPCKPRRTKTAGAGKPVTISSRPPTNWFAWTPDGKLLAEQENGIFQMNADGSNRAPLLHDDFPAFGPISCDHGRYIIFASAFRGGEQLDRIFGGWTRRAET